MEAWISKNIPNDIFDKNKGEYDPLNPYTNLDNIARDIEKFIVDTMKYEDSMIIEDKIIFTDFIIKHRGFLSNMRDFFQEECHVVLVNWIYSLKRNLASSSPDIRVGVLLYNIILIFENFPINRNGILSLKIFEKLNKIRQYLKQYSQCLSGRLHELLKYWKTFINDEDQQVKVTGRKRVRTKGQEIEPIVTGKRENITEEENTEPCSEENFESDPTSPNNTRRVGIVRRPGLGKKKEKKITWNEDKIKTVLEFNIEDAPIEICRDKSFNVNSKKDDRFASFNMINAYGDIESPKEVNPSNV